MLLGLMLTKLVISLLLIFKNSIDNLIDSNQTENEIKKKWSDILKSFNGYRPNHLINLLSLLAAYLWQLLMLQGFDKP